MLQFLRKSVWLYQWALSALAESAVASTWMVVLYSVAAEPRWPEGLPGVWLPLGVYLAAGAWEAGAPKESESQNVRSRRLWAPLVGLALSYGLAYLALPAGLRPGTLLRPSLALAYVPVAGYLWAQGTRNAAERLAYYHVFSRFTKQCLILGGGLVLLILGGVASDSRVQLLLYWNVILLFAAGLSLLVLSRELSMKADQAELGESGADNTSTSPLLSIGILGLLGLTFAASRLLSLERLSVMARVVGGLVGAVAQGVQQIVWLLLYRWALIVGWMAQLVQFTRREPEAPPVLGESGGDPFEELRNQSVATIDIMPYLKAALYVGAILGLLLWLYRLDRSRKRRQTEDEIRINLGFWAGLRAEMQDLLGFLRRNPSDATPVVDHPESLDPRDPRALFRRLQAWGSTLGRPRWEHETPSQYSSALAKRRPDRDEAVDAVTRVYNEAKYSQTPPDGESIQRAVEAVESLQANQGEPMP